MTCEASHLLLDSHVWRVSLTHGGSRDMHRHLAIACADCRLRNHLVGEAVVCSTADSGEPVEPQLLWERHQHLLKLLVMSLDKLGL